jgi:hypothetical protein
MDMGFPQAMTENAVQLVMNFATIFGVMLGLALCRHA